jgi:hypothetical protein
MAREGFRLRAEWVENSSALILDRDSMRRANIHKRYLIHVAGYNLGLIMRLITGAGTPRELDAQESRLSVLCYPAGCCASRHRCVRRYAPTCCSCRHLRNRPVQLNTDSLNGLLAAVWMVVTLTAAPSGASRFHYATGERDRRGRQQQQQNSLLHRLFLLRTDRGLTNAAYRRR